MGNKSGNSYGLTALIPIKSGACNNTSYDKIIRNQLQTWPTGNDSPMAKVPNTYLARCYVLDDVFYQGKPASEDHLESKYIVFSSNFYGDLETYLSKMWGAIELEITALLKNCVAFSKVNSQSSFVAYMKKCQVENSLFFNGSNDLPLARQLKDIYIKQAFSYFTYATQDFQYQGDVGARRLQSAYSDFIKMVDVDNLAQPTIGAAAEEFPHDIEANILKIVEKVTEQEK